MSAQPPTQKDDRATRIWREMQRTLSPAMQRWLQIAIEQAAAQQVALYLVGGPVRDAVLKQPVTDLDLVIEGDAWAVAEAFAAATNGRLTKHAAFRTAVVEIRADGEEHALDFVTARREVYPAPAALPEITPSHIADDLGRRDFTINTLALRLTTSAVTLLDPFDGIGDLAARTIRVLHDASFRDDPTRILRAARFAARLRFEVAPETEALVTAALAEQMIARTSAQRILHELWLTLDEPQPEQALALLHTWGAFGQLGLAWSDRWRSAFAAARSASWPDVSRQDVYTGLLLWPLDAAQRTLFAERYNLPTVARKLLHELAGVPLPDLLRNDQSALELEQLLQAYSIVTLRVLQLVAPPAAAANIARYLNTIRPLPPLLSGADLRAAGVPPGPIYSRLLAELRAAQLAGSLTSDAAAQRWLRERLS